MDTVVAKLRAQRRRGAVEVVGLGECSLDLVYALPGRLGDLAGGKCTARASETLGGGQVATAMCAVRRLGRPAAFLGAVGDDDAGRSVRAGLRSEGVAEGSVVVVPGAATRTALLLVDADGERTVIERRDPALRLPPGYPEETLLDGARVFHVDGTHPEAAVAAARRAAAAGQVISIDLDAPGPAARDLIAVADLCVVPAGFAEALFAEPDRERAARRLADAAAGQVVVTLGAAGSLAVVGGTLRHRPAFAPPGPLVDTTACGDTFRGALIASLLDRADRDDDPDDDDLLNEALRFASAAAALKCLGRGRLGCPTRAQVTRFLSARGAQP